MRALILVMDSVGIGAAPDAVNYGDEGADTVGHIADACMAGRANGPQREGPLRLPNLVALGLGEACRLSTGRIPPGLDGRTQHARYGCASEISRGKDTPSGHWEIAGVPVAFDWGYFPKIQPCFPRDLVTKLCEQGGLPGILGNCHASGTDIIAEFGERHMRGGEPICYTSADSVFQIAAHEETFGLERLYDVCAVARRLVDPLNIGRVIARPFVGTSADNFKRSSHRRDFSVPPPERTILDLAETAGRDIVTIGKIDDIFAHRGTGRNLRGDGNAALFDATLDGLAGLAEGGLLFANFIDFDTLYGHRRDVAGYAAALEAFDARLPELLSRLRSDDLLIITADHGCDPTWNGTDHTREQVPILTWAAQSTSPIGRRAGFADIGATVARHLDLPASLHGAHF
ncbi:MULTISPECIES: phosphopentomutase [Bradyrhizobium]|uniref:phosphopentomutase n=1 Tax=Bradyrhizobium TaxID=374 RepID=UPI00155F4A92|nr:MULTISPECIES: phosphopentomutase [Bradyrhizobium]MDD1518942.1 phosphopentomutase [Bradyrhizobium sp. WBAH30]MDD1541060.1 phosphopentomutase [Bradyrhizobium sp. WBAH41]MDD1557316.1 phosphopentomutase [Bradyrhizobium sp. WBAH23]MDD1563695.1 phosphopentomutase [Bradyrhizobium sp. WBAH33]MDD1590136.1 phosphopentomutase [Bradyrhizobium sp. WBAH42]